MNIYHRFLAQYMLKNGVVAVNDALSYCKHVSQGKIDNLTAFKTLVIELNREISKQFYKIVFNICEVTNENVVVWLNTKNDDISKLQISYSALELEYFHAVLQEILVSESHRITFIVCINITSTLTTHFSRDNGQKVLNKWLQRGYYIKQGDFIYLGPRLILEFTSYLRTHCPDSICNLCSELVFTGKRCGQCHTVLHSYCLSKYLETQTQCPCCKNAWEISAGENGLEDINMETMDELEYSEMTSEMMVGQETVVTSQNTYDETSDESNEVSQISQHRSRRNQRVRNSQQNESSDYEEAGPSSRKRYR